MAALHLTGLRVTSQVDRSMHRRALIAAIVAIAALVAAPHAPLAADFTETLARVDYGLRKNPSRVSQLALDSCRKRRDFAIKLFEARDLARADRTLKLCFGHLKISETPPKSTKTADMSAKDVKAQAAREVEQALAMTPSIERGLEIYRECARCHKPEGWGLSNGSVPQLAGQHSTVIIKQLADIRASSRANPMMLPFACVEAIGSTQAIVDAAGYIDTLEISVNNGKGPGHSLELGERLYRENCVRCHGAKGEGDAEKFIPRIQAQHYKYLARQFRWTRDAKRHNANTEMVAQIQGFKEINAKAVLDYVSRLEPPEEMQAPPDWRNPDFPDQGGK
jgi:cytochrome c553